MRRHVGALIPPHADPELDRAPRPPQQAIEHRGTTQAGPPPGPWQVRQDLVYPARQGLVMDFTVPSPESCEHGQAGHRHDFEEGWDGEGDRQCGDPVSEAEPVQWSRLSIRRSGTNQISATTT